MLRSAIFSQSKPELTTKDLVSLSFGESLTSFSWDANHLYLPLLMTLKVFHLLSDKAELFAMNFTSNSTFDNQCYPLPDFPPFTKLKLCYLTILAQVVKKNSTKATGPDKISVLKNLYQEFCNIGKVVWPLAEREMFTYKWEGWNIP